MNQITRLMCGDPVSLCPCETSPLTPDALERALRTKVADLQSRLEGESKNVEAALVQIAEQAKQYNELYTERSNLLYRLGRIVEIAKGWQRTEMSDAGCCVAVLREVSDYLAGSVVERHESNYLSAGGSANTDPVAGRVIALRSTSDPSAGVDGADRESPQQKGDGP